MPVAASQALSQTQVHIVETWTVGLDGFCFRTNAACYITPFLHNLGPSSTRTTRAGQRSGRWQNPTPNLQTAGAAPASRRMYIPCSSRRTPPSRRGVRLVFDLFFHPFFVLETIRIALRCYVHLLKSVFKLIQGCAAPLNQAGLAVRKSRRHTHRLVPANLQHTLNEPHCFR